MNVLHIGLSDKIGGIEIFLKNIYPICSRNGYRFDFITYEKKAALEDEFINMGCRIFHISSPKYINRYIREMKKILQKNEYRIVHIHKNSCANIIPLLICFFQKKKMKIIVHSHNTASNYGIVTNIIHYINRPLVRNIADNMIACSNVAAEWLYGKKYVKKNKIEIINNGVNFKEFLFDEKKRTEKRKQWNINIVDDIHVICHVGRFVEQKNHAFLINVFRRIHKKDSKAVLLLVGIGDLQQQISFMVKKNNLQKYVYFLGERTDIPELLMASDIFMFPSLYEGFPISLVEAQASNIPCIISDRISKEAIVNRNVIPLGIQSETSVNEWAEQYFRVIRQNVKRTISSNILQSEFNIENTANRIIFIYKHLNEV